MNETPDRDNDDSGNQKRAEVHTDEAKSRHTSHWDTDYMTTEQLEEAHREGREKQRNDDEDRDSPDE